MYESISHILCLMGAIYLVYRITIFLKILFQLIFKPNKMIDNSTKDKISELCHCNFTAFDDLE